MRLVSLIETDTSYIQSKERTLTTHQRAKAFTKSVPFSRSQPIRWEKLSIDHWEGNLMINLYAKPFRVVGGKSLSINRHDVEAGIKKVITALDIEVSIRLGEAFKGNIIAFTRFDKQVGSFVTSMAYEVPEGMTNAFLQRLILQRWVSTGIGADTRTSHRYARTGWEWCRDKSKERLALLDLSNIRNTTEPRRQSMADVDHDIPEL